MLVAFGTLFGIAGLLRLASAVAAAEGSRRWVAWTVFFAGALAAVALLAFVVVAKAPDAKREIAVVASLLIHVPWISYLVFRVRQRSRHRAGHQAF